MSEQKAPEPQDLPTGFQLLEIDPEFRTDPYPRLADLQARCPVRHDPVLESVVVTGYENVRGIVNDRSLWRNPARGNPRDDLITDMVQLQAAGAQLSDQEVSVNLQSLLVGGNLTTTDLIGNGVRAFLSHPEQLAALKADPKLIAMAVEEILRWDPPITMTSRIASCPMDVGGEAVAEKEAMITVLRAANRDPSVYEAPEQFDITRKHVPHMAFGGGAHICIGAPLARMEGQVALWKLFERFPNLKLAEQELVYRALPGFRGLESLLVEP